MSEREDFGVRGEGCEGVVGVGLECEQHEGVTVGCGRGVMRAAKAMRALGRECVGWVLSQARRDNMRLFSAKWPGRCLGAGLSQHDTPPLLLPSSSAPHALHPANGGRRGEQGEGTSGQASDEGNEGR